MYIAIDGQEFNTAKDCREYEKYLELENGGGTMSWMDLNLAKTALIMAVIVLGMYLIRFIAELITAHYDKKAKREEEAIMLENKPYEIRKIDEDSVVITTEETFLEDDGSKTELITETYIIKDNGKTTVFKKHKIKR